MQDLIWRKLAKTCIEWILDNTAEGGGICISNKDRRPYPEVTGYLLGTAKRAGLHDWVTRQVEWLSRIQSPGGSFPDMDGVPRFFDTGMVLHGFLDLGLRNFAPTQRARKYLEEIVDRGDQIVYDAAPGVPDIAHLRAIWALDRCHAHPRYKKLIQRHADDAYDPAGKMLHFYMYGLRGCLESTGNPGIIRQLAERYPDGLVPAYLHADFSPAVNWLCYPALFQWVIVAMRARIIDKPPDGIRDLLPEFIREGGITGGNGDYFPDEQLSWGVKFALDACHLLEGMTIGG